MEPNFQTSFIPKKPMMQEHATRARPVGILTLIACFILFTALLVTGGLYLYKGVLKKDIKDKEDALVLAKKRFKPSKIAELQLLDRRLIASSKVLAQHVAITPIFQALQDITMKTVRYTNFSYDLADDKNGKNAKINIKMRGQAIGYSSVALQSDLFGTKDEAKNFIDPIFSNLSLDDKGNVLFDLEFSVNPSFVDYKQTLLTSTQAQD